MEKRWIGIGVFVVVALVVILTVIRSPERPQTIRIGAILPLTGDAALYGQNAKKGIDLAVDEMNENGGILGKKIVMVYEDTQADPKIGLSAFRKLISIDRVPAIIGSITSSVVLAISPIANEEEVVVLSPAATSPKISEAGKFIFRNWPSDDYEGKFFASYVHDNLGIRKVSILAVNNDYGEGLEEVFRNEFQRLNGSVSASERFDQKERDFRTQIIKIKESEPEGLYVIGYPEEFVMILKQIKELGFKVQLLSTSAFQDKDIIEKGGLSSEGVIYPYPVDPPADDPIVKSFRSEFENKYGEKPGIVCDTAYDALRMIANAIENSKGITGAKIQKGLSSIRNFHGASGLMSFDENGDVEKPMRVRTVKDGDFVDLEKE